MKHLKYIREYFSFTRIKPLSDYYSELKDKYVREEYDDEDFLRIEYYLEKNCKPFLDDLKKMKGDPNSVRTSFFFRGVVAYSYNVSRGLMKKKSRKDRKPRDMAEKVSKDLDESFVKKFGVPLRSVGVFSNKDLNMADPYTYNGDYPFILFPIGEYKFYWSDIRDLYVEVEHEDWYKYIASGEQDGVVEELLMNDGIVEEHFDSRDEFEEYMLGLADEYRQTYQSFLKKSVEMYKEGVGLGEVNDQEAIFICDEYYLVDCAFLEPLMDWIGFGDKNGNKK